MNKANEPKKTDSILLTKLEGCARCGETHRCITFKLLDQACEKFTHWAPCPDTGEPIMLMVYTEED